MIYPSEITRSDQKLLYLFVETIDWYYCGWDWYLNDGYLAAQIPKENDTLYAWVYINFETGFCVDLLEIDSHTCWKNCTETLDLIDSIFSYLPDTAFLDAGPGYDSYSWSTGDSSQIIEVICSDWGAGQWQITVETAEGRQLI